MDEEEKRASPAEATSQPTRRLGEAMGNSNEEPDGAEIDKQAKPKKWSFGVLNDRFTDEVPGDTLHILSTFILVDISTNINRVCSPLVKTASRS